MLAVVCGSHTLPSTADSSSPSVLVSISIQYTLPSSQASTFVGSLPNFCPNASLWKRGHSWSVCERGERGGERGEEKCQEREVSEAKDAKSVST